MDDFDFEDWFTGSSYVEPGIPVSIPDISVSNFNLGSLDLGEALSFGDVLGSLDLSDAINFGDLSGIVDLGPTKYDYLSNIDYGYGVPGGIQDLIPETTYTREETPFIPRDVDVIRDISDIIPETTYTKETTPFVPRDVNVIRDISDVIPETTYTKEETPFVPRDSEVIPGYATPENVFEYGYTKEETPFVPRDVDVIPGYATPENVFEYGYTKEETPFVPRDAKILPGYVPTAGTPGGSEVIKTPPKSEPTKTEPTKTEPTKTTTTTPDKDKSIIDRIFGTTGKDSALLMALLGGLLGLLGKGSSSNLPVGYQGGIPKYKATRVPGRGVQYTRAAGGGLMDLAQGGRPARYLRGGTDGMADEIKTDIDGKQPARLSHGEFVIPADVVSHLGNGNSDAGADVLYDMMAKVRKARTGTTKQGKQINPRKMIPA
jgi:hypothetical protein